MSLCIRCGRCIEVCPYDSVRRADVFEKLLIGTPFVFPLEKACQLCMKCPPVCPTGALDNALAQGRNVRMGTALIKREHCLNYRYVEDEKAGRTDGSARICSVCYNECPYRDEAIVMERYLLPVVTDRCVGCGICAEKCPVDVGENVRAVNIVPRGMGVKEHAGIHHRRTRIPAEPGDTVGEALHGEELIEKKESISTGRQAPEFDFEYNIDETVEGWE